MSIQHQLNIIYLKKVFAPANLITTFLTTLFFMAVLYALACLIVWDGVYVPATLARAVFFIIYFLGLPRGVR